MSKKDIEQMDSEKLVKYVIEMENNSRSYLDTTLQPKWAVAQKYYYGEKLGNEKEGHSQVISRDVSDSIDWIMPALMEIFASGKRSVQYIPTQSEHADSAEQRTDYANYVFFDQNKGFTVTHNWFKDALLFNVGVVKHYWESRIEVVSELYEGLEPMELAMLLSKEGVEQVELTENEDGTADIRVNFTKDASQIVVMNIKPEDFLIDSDATCVDDAKFVGESKRVTLSDLREMGFDEETIGEVKRNTYREDSDLRYVREDYNGGNTSSYDDIDGGEANNYVTLTEAYIRIDFDGDGIAELRRVVYSGNTVLENDPWDTIPYSTLTPNPIQHQFYGQSIYDETKDIQDVKTALIRNQLDNMYLTNNGRYSVVEGQVNLNDLQNNTIGGVVRQKMIGALTPLEQPQLPQGAYDMLGYMDELKTNRTGVSARSQGLDDKVLNSHTGQGQVNKVMSVAEQRQKLVARIFAETGFTNLFKAIYQLTTRNQKGIQSFFKDGSWIQVDPSTWEDDTQVKVVTGLGANNDDQQLAYLSRMFELTQAIINGGGLDTLTNEEKIHNILKEMTEASGFKDTSRFWLDPTTPQGMESVKNKRQAMAQPSPDQIKADADMKEQESNAQQAMIKLQMDKEANQREHEVKMQELALKEREMAMQERELALKESEQDLEVNKFEWSKQVNITEVILEKESQRAHAIGDNKILKGRSKGTTDAGAVG